MRLQYFFLIILLFMSFVSSLTEKEFFNKANETAYEIKGNFSLGEAHIKIKIVNLSSGSAEAQKIFGTYLIRIDYEDFANTSDEEITGLLAHELSHLESYKDKNFLYMAAYGLHYQFSAKFKKEVERSTDENAINRGYGKELLAFKEYRLSTANPKDKKYFQENYLSIEETRKLANLS